MVLKKSDISSFRRRPESRVLGQLQQGWIPACTGETNCSNSIKKYGKQFSL